ncbi:hypothetical protein OE88DRAFT_1654259 [Heliocybe sulcata]|uniref:Uncharacterized protein n=1 Tax=Heliocybe sulcata TaxID=5364 RepID=A0A5C3N977_9AGAM|nr:hypothetical protein OE88DRAFT_1654259 [Heliocybe sulcata]
MSDLNWNQRNMIALFVSTFCWGLYTALFGACIYALLSPKGSQELQKTFLLVTVVLYALSTAQAVLMFWQAFVSTDLASVADASVLRHERLLVDIGGIIGQAFTPCATRLVADGLLIWRCYALWSRRLSVIIVPTFLLLAGVACGFAQVGISARLYSIRLHAPLDEVEPPPIWAVLVSRANTITTVMYVTSCVTNIMMSGLIAFRIWDGARDIGKRKTRYHRIASLFLETGVLYAICQLLAAIWFPLQENSTSGAIIIAVDTISNILQQLVGIFPTVIILLVALGKTAQQTTEYSLSAGETPRRPSEISAILFATPPPGVKMTEARGATSTVELEQGSIVMTSTSREQKAEKV